MQAIHFMDYETSLRFVVVNTDLQSTQDTTESPQVFISTWVSYINICLV